MLTVCNSHLVETPKEGDLVNRTLDVLEAAKKEPEGLSGALDRYTKKLRDQWRDGK